MDSGHRSWDGEEPTPAELRDLQARADALARDVTAMRQRLTAQPRGVRQPLPGAADAIARAARGIGLAAERLARTRAAVWQGSCTAWWGICPRCEPTLESEDGRSWCRQCGTGWGYDRSQGPCGEPGGDLAMDEQGGHSECTVGDDAWDRDAAAIGQLFQFLVDKGHVSAQPWRPSRGSLSSGVRKDMQIRHMELDQYVFCRDVGFGGLTPAGALDYYFGGFRPHRNRAVCELAQLLRFSFCCRW